MSRSGVAAVLDALKARAPGLGQHVRKSGLPRAGIRALDAMNDRARLAAVGAVPASKTGRPREGLSGRVRCMAV